MLESDWKFLRSSSNKSPKQRILIFIVLTLFFLVLSAISFYAGHQRIQTEGLSLWDLLYDDISKFSAKRNFNITYIRAYESFFRAGLAALCAVLTIFVAILDVKAIKRNSRILAKLEEISSEEK